MEPSPGPAEVWRQPGRAWCGLAALSGLATLAAQALPAVSIDWQPERVWSQPWRCWTAAFVHYSGQHLTGNLLAVLLVAAYGWAARLPARSALAWALSWPLLHLALLSEPELRHYGGLSGLLHAGVAVATLGLLFQGGRGPRWVGALTLALLCAKVFTETPWRAAVQYPADWDIPIAPIAHLTGLAAGILCGLAMELVARGSQKPAARH